MSQSTSATILPSPFPNVLYNPMAVDAAANTDIQAKQQIGATNMEMVGRAAGSLLGMSEPDAAAAYPAMVKNLQSQGFAMNAPADYPGHAAVQAMVQSSIPIGQQYQYGILTAPGVTDAINRATAPLTFGNTGTGGTGAGGTSPPTSASSGGPRASLALGQDQIGNAQAIRDGLVARGMDPETALAMAANSLGESGGNWQTAPGDSGVSHGLFQWNGDRLAAFQAANGGKLPEQTSLGAQLDFAANEWKADHNGAATAAGQFNIAEGKIAPIVSKYEVSANQPADIARRSAYLNWLRAAGVGAREAHRGLRQRQRYRPRRSIPTPGHARPPSLPHRRSRCGRAARMSPDLAPGPGCPTFPRRTRCIRPDCRAFRSPVRPATRSRRLRRPPRLRWLRPPRLQLPCRGHATPAYAQPPASGQNSPQFQAAIELYLREQALEMVVDPTGRSNALDAILRAQAALYMQADSVSTTIR